MSVKTKAEINNEWRDGDRLIPPALAAEMMGVSMAVFNRIDAQENRKGWPRKYVLSPRTRRYSYLDTVDFVAANKDIKPSDTKYDEAELALLHINPHLCDDEDFMYFEHICELASKVDADIGIDTLACLVREGPLEEGNLPSKVQRDQLSELKIITPVMVQGRQGWWGANYNGDRVLKLVEHRRKIRGGK